MAWVGDEFVVLGGRSGWPCPPAANCILRAPPRHLRDAAAFDPRTSSWRRLPNLPVNVSSLRTDAVVSSGVLYLHPRDGRTMLTYETTRAAWQREPGAPAANSSLVDVGGTLVAVARDRDGVDAAYDPASQTWQRLPVDPFGEAAATRIGYGVDGRLVLVETPRGKGSRNRSALSTRAASLAVATQTWTPLTAGGRFGLGLVAGGRIVVSPSPEVLVGEPPLRGTQSWAAGGIFDPVTGTWESLPAGRPAAWGGLPGRVIVSACAEIGGHLIDPVSRTWLSVPTLGEQRSGDLVAGSPGYVLAWGGVEMWAPVAEKETPSGYLLTVKRH